MVVLIDAATVEEEVQFISAELDTDDFRIARLEAVRFRKKK